MKQGRRALPKANKQIYNVKEPPGHHRPGFFVSGVGNDQFTKSTTAFGLTGN
jgi:hypothetical protein